MDEPRLPLPTPNSFTAVQSAKSSLLKSLSYDEVRCILPSLVRAVFSNTIARDDISFNEFKNAIHAKLSMFKVVENISHMLKIDFKMVQDDVLNKQQLRQKISSYDGNLSDNTPGLLEFENSNPLQRMRLVLCELMRVSLQVKGMTDYKEDDSELFENSIYLEEISDMICIAFSELPYLLNAPEVSEALLHLRFGPWILCKIVVNNPDCFDVVCSSILSHAKASDDSLDIDTATRIKTLKMLCQMNPQYNKVLRAECVSLCKLAGLAVELSIDDTGRHSDLVSFFTGLLLASNSKTREWLSEFIKHVQKDNKEHVHKDKTLMLLKQQLLKEMKVVIHSFQSTTLDSQSIADETGDDSLSNPLMHGIAIMRLYCAFKTINGFKFSHEESEMMIDLITCLPPPTDVGIRFIVVALCTLVACAFLIGTQEREDKVVAWLKMLIEKSSIFQSHSSNTSSYGETLLLIAIHFHGHTLEPIVDLVSSTLGIKLRPSSLTKLKILFTQTIFPEKIVAEHALTVPVTQNLNRTMRTFLPAHCIHQLLKSRVFTKHAISVKDWLFKQICSCSTPVHPLMIELIETYVQAIVNTINISKTKHQKLGALDPFSEEDMLAVFQKDSRIECYDYKTSQVLLMMFCLMYQRGLLENMKTLVNNPKAPREYTTHLYSTIPMKQLLIETRSNEESYGHLYPSMLRLLATYYPHLCLVEDWISEEELLGNDTRQTGNRKQDHRPPYKAIEITNEDPQKIIVQLSRLTVLDPNRLIPYEDDIIKLLPKMLEITVPRKIQLLVVKLWMKLNIVIPRRLLQKTVNILRNQPENIRHDWEKLPQYTEEEIQKDPLIVLRCDKKVFRCPPLFEILLRTLRGYMTSSRALLNHHILSNPLFGDKYALDKVTAMEKDREELKSALISSQESAVLQILLEVCLPTSAEKKRPNYTVTSTLREIQCQVCCFLHQCFISHPSMAKLLHFQGYSPELLPVATNGIPSIHICIDFIPELMNQPYLEKQLFAVQLISYLAIQYPIPKSFAMCKYVIQQMNDLLAALPVAKRNQFFVPALGCMERMSKAFPPIREEITDLLLKIGRIGFSQLSNSSLTPISMVKFREEKEEETKNAEGSTKMEDEEDFEMDIDEEEKSNERRTPGTHQIKTILDSDCKEDDLFTKYCSSEKLVTTTELVFKNITNHTLRDKLVLLLHEDKVTDT